MFWVFMGKKERKKERKEKVTRILGSRIECDKKRKRVLKTYEEREKEKEKEKEKERKRKSEG